MQTARRLIRHHRHLTGIVLVLVLALRVIVPSGFMPTVSDGRIVVAVCSGSGPMSITRPPPATHAVAGLHGDRNEPEHQPDHGKMDQPCAFAGLSTLAIAAVDAALLTVALALVAALAVRIAAPLATARASYLRPPLRGPPAAA